METETLPRGADAYIAEVGLTAATVQSVAIVTAEDYVGAAEHLLAARAKLKEADAIFDPTIESAHETHKRAVAAKKRATAGLVEAVSLLSVRMGDWKSEQDRKVAAARLAADRDLREREQLAREAEAQGNPQLATEVRAIPVAVAPLPQAAPKVDGVSTRKTYTARVLDVRELVKAVAAGLVPINAVEPNMVFLNSLARSAKNPGIILPGVESVETTGVAVRV